MASVTRPFWQQLFNSKAGLPGKSHIKKQNQTRTNREMKEPETDDQGKLADSNL